MQPSYGLASSLPNVILYIRTNAYTQGLTLSMNGLRENVQETLTGFHTQH